MLHIMRAAQVFKWQGSLSVWLASLLVLTLSACTGVGGGGGDEEALGNTPPRITSLAFSVVRGTTLNGQLVATDPDGGPLQFAVIASTTNGTLTVQPSGAFTYVPNANFTGPDTFVARVTDPPGASTSATITITVTAPVNRPPTLTTTAFTVQSGMTLNAQLIGVDPEGGAVTFTVVTTTANGTLVLQPTGAFTYTPNAGFSGPDPFQVRLTDPQGAAFTGTVTITVTPLPNQPPVLTSTAFTVVSDRPYNGQLTATDPENQTPITFAKETDPANGTLTVQADGMFVYTPNTGFAGTDTFNIRVTDPLGAFSIGTVTMTVTANRAPIAVDDEFSYPSGSEVTLPVTDNDSDPDNDPLTVELQGPAFGGTATVVGGTMVRVQLPVANFQGLVRFQYLVRDPGGLASNIATAIAFVGTPPFRISWLGDEFTAGTRELALADLLVPPRRVNGPLAAGNVTDYTVAANNAATFAYVVDNRNAFFTTAAALGTGNPLYAPITAPSVHRRTTVSPDGTRICSTYFDNASTNFRSFVFDASNPTAGTTVAITNNPICFEFLNGANDILYLGQQGPALLDDPAIYRAPTATPSALTRLTRPAGFYTNGGWQTDQVFVSPDSARVLFRQTRNLTNLRGVYELIIANPQNEALLSEEFAGFGRPVASVDRNRIAFASANLDPDIFGYDRGAPQVRVTLFPGAAGRAPSTPVFSIDGSRVAYLDQDLSFVTQPRLCDTPFSGPFGCTALLTGYRLNSNSIQYSANAAELLVLGEQAAGDLRLLQVPRATPGVPTILSPNGLFAPFTHEFAQTGDSAVVAVALRATATGPLQVYLINRAVPGEALLISTAAATNIAAGTIRFIAR